MRPIRSQSRRLDPLRLEPGCALAAALLHVWKLELVCHTHTSIPDCTSAITVEACYFGTSRVYGQPLETPGPIACGQKKRSDFTGYPSMRLARGGHL